MLRGQLRRYSGTRLILLALAIQVVAADRLELVASTDSSQLTRDENCWSSTYPQSETYRIFDPITDPPFDSDDGEPGPDKLYTSLATELGRVTSAKWPLGNPLASASHYPKTAHPVHPPNSFPQFPPPQAMLIHLLCRIIC